MRLYFTMSASMSAEERKKVVEALPKRSDFVAKDLRLKKIDGHDEDKYYLCTYVQDMTRKVGKSLEYNILTTGVRPNGEKIGVFVRGYKPNFLFAIPKDTSYLKIKTRVEALAEGKVWDMEVSDITGKNFKYYSPAQQFIKLSFKNTISRKKMKDILLKFTYENDQGVPSEYAPEFLNDDMHHIYRAASRERKLKFCMWWRLKDMHSIDDFKFKGFEVHIDDIEVIKEPPTMLKRDKTMTMQWDLETFSYNPTGQAPDFRRILNEHKKKQNVIFMNTMSFHWYLEKTPLVIINTTSMPTPDVENCVVVQTKNDEDIIALMAIMIERMSPEIINGFNTSGYDWLFVLNTIDAIDEKKKHKDLMAMVSANCPSLESKTKDSNYKNLKFAVENYTYDLSKSRKNLLSVSFITEANCDAYMKKIKEIAEKNFLRWFKTKLCMLKPTDDILKYMVRGQSKIEIKLEGQTKIEMYYFDAPGILNTDTRIIFRKLYYKAEESNLNFYLKSEKLKTKLDMPYSRMFKIFIILKTLKKMYGLHNYEDIIAKYKENPVNLTIYDFNKKYFNPKSEFYIAESSLSPVNLTGGEAKEKVLELLADAGLVADYCNQDALACHDLFLKRNIIKDNREWANLAYVSFCDTMYYADGMKVRNVIMAYGNKDKFKIFYPVSKSVVKSEKKYPGAHVEFPKKGMYKYHKFDKRAKRSSYINSTLENKEQYLKSDDFNERFPLTEAEAQNPDLNDKNDRPMTPLDFASLYPNLIRTHNLSPEMVIPNANYTGDMIDGKRVLTTTFKYDDPDKKEEEKQSIIAHVVQYTEPTIKGGMGIYAYILSKLYAARSKVKKLMAPYEAAKNVLAKTSVGSTDDLKVALDKLLSDAHKLCASGKKFYIKEYENLKRTIDFILKTLAGTDDFTSDGTFTQFYDYIIFYFNYYNAKQLAIKIFMNTFYGDTGNSTSPFFTVEVAGSITTRGQKAILSVKDFSIERGYNVLYGDTDSLYMTVPEHHFAELDVKYESGQISKIEYWETMIEITQEVIDVYGDEVNDFLFKEHGSDFLQMDCEGIAWPYMLCGKKKYMMLKHLGISNLDICKGSKTCDEILACRNLDVRGFEIKKRGASKFLKQKFGEILATLFSMENTETLFDLVNMTFKEIKSKEYDLSFFVKSAKYSPPSPGKPGNVAVVEFINRMKAIQERLPEIGITIPQPSDRFKFIITKKYPFKYNTRGGKKDISAGEKYEFYDSFSNVKYQALLDEPLSVDMDYYISHEIVGQMARLLTYHPNFESDDDKKSHDMASKYLLVIFAAIRDKVEDKYGAQKKREYTEFAKEFEKDQPKFLKQMNKIITSVDVKDNKFKSAKTITDIQDALIKVCERDAKVPNIDVHDYMSVYSKRFECSIQQLFRLYAKKNSYGIEKLRYLDGKISKIKKDLKKKVEEYQLTLVDYKFYIENSFQNKSDVKFDYDTSMMDDLLKLCDTLKAYIGLREQLAKFINKIEEEFNYEQTKMLKPSIDREAIFIKGVEERLKSPDLDSRLSKWQY